MHKNFEGRDSRIILKCILYKQDVKVSAGFIWLGKEYKGGF
jgi:hypothetical protein